MYVSSGTATHSLSTTIIPLSRHVFIFYSVTSCSFAPVGWLLASGGTSGEVILFDVFAKKSKRKVEAHDLGVNWVEFYPCQTTQDRLLLATAGQDNNVKLWNVVISQRESLECGV